MQQYNIHHAKTHLSQLVDQAANGRPFVIAKAGKPLVQVIPLDAPPTTEMHRLGFMKNAFQVPDDFDTLGAEEIEHLFDE